MTGRGEISMDEEEWVMDTVRHTFYKGIMIVLGLLQKINTTLLKFSKYSASFWSI
jgi:hypothetical protein